MTSRTAVIGAGLAGLSCARTLRLAGHYVEIFEEDRIIGGRMGTMRVGVVPYDHGAQYVTTRSARFRQYVDELVGTGYATPWSPRMTAGSSGTEAVTASGWYVGVPGMSSLVRPLAESVRIHTGKTAHTISKVGKGWTIWFDDQTTAGPYAAVAIAVPAPRARLLLGPLTDMAEHISRVRMGPCWALLARLDERTLPEPDVYSDMSEVIRWVARNNTKPGRASRGETIVVHASPGWSRETEDVEPDVVAGELWGEVSHVLGLPPVRPTVMTAHLWRTGLVEQALGEMYVYSTEHRVGVAGDWCFGRLAEHAFESGQALAKAIVGSLD
ncbi:MAG: FAD-dependent oxidoreductase [Hyphomicrobiaceae bacterium]|nr:FAD-dependent oxidoreductase [Hyphomicrobiaceae bacterium]